MDTTELSSGQKMSAAQIERPNQDVFSTSFRPHASPLQLTQSWGEGGVFAWSVQIECNDKGVACMVISEKLHYQEKICGYPRHNATTGTMLILNTMQRLGSDLRSFQTHCSDKIRRHSRHNTTIRSTVILNTNQSNLLSF